MPAPFLFAVHRGLRALRQPAVLGSLLLLAGLTWLLVNGISQMDYTWRWQRLGRFFLQQREGKWQAGALAKGLWVTLKLSLVAGALALLFGVVAAAARLAPLPSLRFLATAYVQCMRCTPLLVQLYLLYFMFGSVLGVERFTAGALALALFEGAFVAEILRAGYLAVPQAQVDAAHALGLTARPRWQQVILPQALPLMLPPLANLFVSLIKHTSIVTIIAVADLTDAARNAVADTFLAFEIWLCVGGLYVALCMPLALLVRSWEDALHKKR